MPTLPVIFLSILIAANALTWIQALAIVAFGAGSGGVIGGYVALRKARSDEKIGMASLDVEAFKAQYPEGWDGLIERLREDASSLWEDVVELRDRERANTVRIIELETENGRLRRDLELVKADLARARERIATLESQ